MKTLRRSYRYLLASSLILASAYAAAASSPGGSGGLHIHLSSHSPYLREAARATLDVQRRECTLAVGMCAQLPVLNDDVQSRKFCAQAHAFSMHGTPEDIGDAQIDEYVSVELHTQARYEAIHILRRDGLCEASVIVQKKIDIWQTMPAGTLHYALREHADKSPVWSRNESKPLPPAAAALAMTMHPIASGTLVGAAQGRDQVAGHVCHVHPVTGPIHGTLCLMPTAAAASGYASLRTRLMSESTVMLDVQAVTVENVVVLPVDKLQPPPNVGQDDRGKPASTNATQRWCVRQAQLTGRNPCTQTDDDR